MHTISQPYNLPSIKRVKKIDLKDVKELNILTEPKTGMITINIMGRNKRSYKLHSLHLCCSRKYPYMYLLHGCLFLGFEPLTSPKIPVKLQTFLSKFWLLRPPTPSKFPMANHGIGMDIFWNHTLRKQSCRWTTWLIWICS